MIIICLLLIIDIIIYAFAKPTKEDFKLYDLIPGSGFYYMIRNMLR